MSIPLTQPCERQYKVHEKVQKEKKRYHKKDQVQTNENQDCPSFKILKICGLTFLTVMI